MRGYICSFYENVTDCYPSSKSDLKCIDLYIFHGVEGKFPILIILRILKTIFSLT